MGYIERNWKWLYMCLDLGICGLNAFAKYMWVSE